MEAGALTSKATRGTGFGRSPVAKLPDQILRWGLTLLAAGILALIAYFFIKLANESSDAFSKFGVFGFTFTNNWDVSADSFGALPLVVGTLITSAIALTI